MNWKTLITTPNSADGQRGWKTLFILLCAGLLITMLGLSRQAGINQDERFHIPNAKTMAKFYTSFGKDRSFLEIEKSGTSGFEKAQVMMDMITLAVNRALGNSEYEMEFHRVRHMILAMVGFLAILFTGLLARHFIGWQGAVLTVILLFLSPRFLGHSMMNPRDIPFAAFYTMSLFFLVRYMGEFPKVKWSTVLWMTLAVTLTLNVRVGGYLIHAYIFMAAGLLWAYHTFVLKTHRLPTQKLFVQLAVLTVVSFAGGLLFWPYGLTDPLHKPLEHLLTSADYPMTLRQIFEGETYMSKDLPWYYPMKFVMITAPLAVLIAGAAFFPLWWMNRKKTNNAALAMVAFAFAFPILYIMYSKANVYNGCRHVLFIIPPLVILAASAWLWLGRALQAPWAKGAVAAVLLVLCLGPAAWIFSNPSFLYVYFNPLVGGIQGAHGQYETDYWATSVSHGGMWLRNELGSRNGEEPQKMVRSNGSFGLRIALDGETSPARAGYIRYYERATKPWDYLVVYAGGVDAYQLQKEIWPPKNALHVVQAGGVPLAAVVPRDPEQNDLKGSQAMRSNNFDLAIDHLEKAVAFDNQNETLYESLGQAYLQKQNPAQAKTNLARALQLRPASVNARFYYGISQLMGGEAHASILTFNEVLKGNPNFGGAYRYLAQAYNQIGDRANAKRYADIAARIK